MAMKIVHVVGLMALVVLMSSCIILPPEVRDLNADMREIKLSINRIQVNQNDIHRMVSANLDVIKNKEDENFEYIIELLERLEEKLNSIENDSTILRGQLEELKFNLAKGSDLASLNMDADIIATPSSEFFRNAHESDTLFDTAHKAYIKVDYRAALDMFSQFVNDNPYSDRLPDAKYWIGDCYYKLGEYGTALTQLSGYASKYPLERQAPNAYLKMALCYKQLNREEDYKKTLETMLVKFPDFDQAARVRAMLKEMP